MGAKNLTTQQSRGDLRIHHFMEFFKFDIKEWRQGIDTSAIDRDIRTAKGIKRRIERGAEDALSVASTSIPTALPLN